MQTAASRFRYLSSSLVCLKTDLFVLFFLKQTHHDAATTMLQHRDGVMFSVSVLYFIFVTSNQSNCYSMFVVFNGWLVQNCNYDRNVIHLRPDLWRM